MPGQAVFLATLCGSQLDMVMGLFMSPTLCQVWGLNAFHLHRVCFGLGFTWQALAMVFLCGIFNILITVTKIRKLLIVSISPTTCYFRWDWGLHRLHRGEECRLPKLYSLHF